MMTQDNREILGREFHNSDSNYSLPGDFAEHQRLGNQHRVLKLMAGSNCLAPVSTCVNGPTAILDLCCGSGHWVIDMAEEYPNAEVIGLDIVTPKVAVSVPKNCKFVIGDVKTRLPFEDETFDLVQMRTVPSVPDRGPILKEIGRILRPGGYVCFIEPYESFSGTLGKRTSAMIEVDRLLLLSPHTPRAEDGSVRKTWSIAKVLTQYLSEAKDPEGRALFDAIESKAFLIPVGPWQKDERLAEVGRVMARVQNDLVRALGPVYIRDSLITPEEMASLQQAVEDEVKDLSLELQVSFTYAWARRVQLP